MNGLTSIVMSQGSWFWKEAGCRKGFSTLVGQMLANAKLVKKRMVQKRTDSTIVQVGMKSGAKSQRPAESGNKSEDEVSKRYCYASSKLMSMEQGHFSMKKWSLQKGLKAMRLQMALFWE